MSLTERYNRDFRQNPANVMHEATAKAWHNATEAAWQAGTSAAENAGWAFNNPFEAMERMFDGTRDAAITRWNKLRDFYGAGGMAWNTIVDVWDNPCSDKWGVAIDLALPIAGDTLAILLTPSLSEILEEYLDPKQSRGRRGRREDNRDKRRKRGKSGRKRRGFGGPPDPDGLTASIIPGAAAMSARNAFGPTRWFFTGIAISDLDAITWMLVDLTSDGLVQWSSGMREARFCSAGFNVALTSEQTAPVKTVNYTLDAGDFDPDQGEKMEWIGGDIIYNPPGAANAEVLIIASIRVRNTTEDKTINDLRFQLDGPGFFQQTKHGELGAGESVTLGIERSNILMSPQQELKLVVAQPGTAWEIDVTEGAVTVAGFSPPP